MADGATPEARPAAEAEEAKTPDMRFDKLKASVQKIQQEERGTIDATETQKTLGTAFKADLLEIKAALDPKTDMESTDEKEDIDELIRLINEKNNLKDMIAVLKGSDSEIAKTISALPEFQILENAIDNVDALLATADRFATAMEGEEGLRDHMEATGLLDKDPLAAGKESVKGFLEKGLEGPLAPIILMIVEGLLNMEFFGNFLYPIVEDKMIEKWQGEIASEAEGHLGKHPLNTKDAASKAQLKLLYKQYQKESGESKPSFSTWVVDKYVDPKNNKNLNIVLDYLRKNEDIPVFPLYLDEVVKLRNTEGDINLSEVKTSGGNHSEELRKTINDAVLRIEKSNEELAKELSEKLDADPSLLVQVVNADNATALTLLNTDTTQTPFREEHIAPALNIVKEKYDVNFSRSTWMLREENMQATLEVKGGSIDLTIKNPPGAEAMAEPTLAGIQPENLKAVIDMLNNIGKAGDAEHTLAVVKDSNNAAIYEYEFNNEFWDGLETTLKAQADFVNTWNADTFKNEGNLEGTLTQNISPDNLWRMAMNQKSEKGTAILAIATKNGVTTPEVALQKAARASLLKQLDLEGKADFNDDGTITVKKEYLNDDDGDLDSRDILTIAYNENSSKWVVTYVDDDKDKMFFPDNTLEPTHVNFDKIKETIKDYIK